MRSFITCTPRKTAWLSWTLRALIPAILAVPAAFAADTPKPPAAPDKAGLDFFETKIRPLLAAECYSCHSVSAKKVKAQLFADSLQGLIKGGESGSALVPGQPMKSKLVEAVLYKNQDLQMPPDSKLSDAQVADLTHWVEIGAPWPEEAAPHAGDGNGAKIEPFDLKKRKSSHWAWQPVKPHVLPAVANAKWVSDPIDNFILNKLEAIKLAPAPAADKRTLLRRASFDLTGLPPKPEDIDAFLKDESPQAFEKVVDRLLASPQYGERWARHWLDLTRYAESYGHEFDFQINNAFRYRDYVIRALNADVPYDQFAIEHLAGDLVEKPRMTPDGLNESVCGTAFYFLGENVHSPVDVRQHQADRFDNEIEVISKTFLGLTLNCARCHDHKFDALSTADYYALYGYLKSSRYDQAALNQHAIQAKATELANLKKELLAKSIAGIEKKADGLADALLKFAPTAKLPPNHPLYPLVRMQKVPAAQFEAKWKEYGVELGNNAKGQQGAVDANAETALKAPIQFEESAFEKGPGFVPGADAKRPIAEVREGAWISSDGLSRKLQGTARTPSFKVEKPFLHVLAKGKGGRISVVMDNFVVIRAPIYGGLRHQVHTEKEQWYSFDLKMWQGHVAYLEFADTTVGLPGEDTGLSPDDTIAARDIVFSNQGNHPSIIDAADSSSMAAFITSHKAPDSIETLSKILSNEVVDALKRVETKFASVTHRDAELINTVLHAGLLDVAATPEMEALLKRYHDVEAAIPAPIRVPSIADGNGENEYVFIRGSSKNVGPVVPRRFLEGLTEPSALAPASPSEGSGRMDLAKRIVDRADPFFSRVMVNRLWHHLFGVGIVASTDNFGKLGEEPTHPELLDFLAQRFIQDGYSIKKTIRRMMLSTSYRMASAPNSANDSKLDPSNKLLAHQRIKRLEGESIRDTVLAVSGRLDPTMYGPSVDVHLTPFMTGRGRPGNSGPVDGAGRRSIYISIRRNFLSPMMAAFDAPSPFSTMGRRTVSNVPAQALILLNDPLVLSQADLWAKRELANKTAKPAEHIANMYHAAFARDPIASETSDALAFIDEQTKQPGGDANSAWKDYAHVLMNAKEFIFIK